VATVLTRPVERGTIPTVPQRPAAAAAPAPASFVEYGWRRIAVVAGVMLAALLQTIDATIVNVALPTIQGNLGANVDAATWAITAYVISNVVVIPLAPWLQSRLGRKNYFLISIAGFTVASVLCGLSTSLTMLIVFRIVQGAFGGGLLATAQVILRDTFPPEALGTSQSIYTLAAVLGPSVGPTIGGILTDNYSWPWVFDVNVVPGIVSFVLLALFLRGNSRQRSPIDALGIALLIAFVGSLQYVLDQGQLDDWFSSTGICTAAVIAVVACIAFVWWELRTPRPIVDLRVLARPAVAIGSLIGIGIASIIYGGLIVIPQYVVLVLGFTSTLAGMLIAVRALPIAVLTIPVGRLTNQKRIPLPFLISGGLLTAAGGCYVLAGAITSGSTFGSLAPGLFITGFGVTFVFSPTLVYVLRAVTPPEIPKAASFITLFTQLGGSIAAACLVAFIEQREDLHQAVLASTVTLSRPAVASFLKTNSAGALSAIVNREASTMAYADAFYLLAAIGACSALLPYLTYVFRKARS
jgi:DHA2 family multidrug resistance protein